MKNIGCLEGETLEAMVSLAQYDPGSRSLQTQLARIL